ncbi:UDP-N-acetylmuramoyl-tripeptide--D-alanyl-D-alanine ligase [Niallia sp. BSM11]|uniref:UDP-N-acetylmuramoyl-tripeptide--D-alanyl-D- alanine ligase n=1 Tax=Niallia sp. BSM11 TaxID=3391576 RepID=UPI003984DFF8
MIRRSLQQAADMIGPDATLSSSDIGEVIIHGVTIDSRKIQPGNLFIPFKGDKTDGHKYVEAAIQNGAAASFWQKDVPNPPEHLPLIFVSDPMTSIQNLAKSYRHELDIKVVGITGSNGKTSTKDITTNLLSLKYKVQKTEGNYNNHLGLPLTVLSLEEDTDVAVLEMGMSGRGEIDFLTKLAEPDVVVITNIGESHLQDLGSREGIAEAKLEILNGLKKQGRIVYFGDEPLLAERIPTFDKPDAAICSFGLEDKNSLYPFEIEESSTGSKFKINKSDKEFSLPILGKHNILNALAAMLVADYFDISYEKMDEGFQNLKLTNMRMELLEGQGGLKVINDAYNASPTSMRAAINVLQSLPGFKHKVLVLGDMLELGPDEATFHYEIGEEIDAAAIDYVFTFGELGKHIAQGAKTVFANERVQSFLDKSELIQELKKVVDGQTAVLVKASRGMRLEEVVKALQ